MSFLVITKLGTCSIYNYVIIIIMSVIEKMGEFNPGSNEIYLIKMKTLMMKLQQYTDMQ